MIFETERLAFRELVQADLMDLAEILKDREVMYAYEHDFTHEDVEQWLQRQRDRYRQWGYGLWAAILKETGELIGQAGLTMQSCEGHQVLEIGYLLKRKHWHKGYGVEAALGCKKYAFEQLGAPRVYSIIKTDNGPSIGVAKAMGMRLEKEFEAVYYNGSQAHYLFVAEQKGE